MGLDRKIMRTIKLQKRPSKKLVMALVALAIIASLFIIGHVTALKGTVKNQQVELNSSKVELQTQKAELNQANKTLEQIKLQKEQSEQEKQRLEQEKKDLEAQLQAKAEQKNKLAAAAESVVNTLTGTATASAASLTGSGCDYVQSRLAANGVSAADMPAAMYIAYHESTCNPGAQNSNGGACNIFQELPCGKWGGLSDVDAHIQGATAYANQRYGGWQGAYAFWVANQWW
jgi:primosomal protein N'